MRPLPSRLSGSCLACALALSAAAPAAAQERLPGGRVLTFGTTIGLTSSDNYTLNPGGPGRTEATLGFSLGLVTATPLDRIELTSNMGLRLDSRSEELELTSPNLALSWVRAVRDQELRFDASIRRDEIEDLSPLDLVVGDVTDLNELEDLLNNVPASSTATRLAFSASAALELGRTAPLGTTLSLGVSGVRYEDAGPSYRDNTRINAGLRFRGDLDSVTVATLDLSGTTYVVGDQSDVGRLTFGVTRTGRTAAIGASLGVTTEDAGTQTSLSINGTLERPLGSLSGRLGIARGATGDLALIGGAGVAVELPQGDLRLDLDRRVGFVENRAAGVTQERTVTTLTAAWNQPLTEFWQLGIDGRYARTETVGGGAGGTDSYGEIGSTLSRPLTRDWSVNFGVRHRFELDDNGPDARASSVSISLSRAVRLPF